MHLCPICLNHTSQFLRHWQHLALRQLLHDLSLLHPELILFLRLHLRHPLLELLLMPSWNNHDLRPELLQLLHDLRPVRHDLLLAPLQLLHGPPLALHGPPPHLRPVRHDLWPLPHL